MTNRETPVPLDEAHVGDLIGYTRAGKPIFLPGGGAPRDGEIVADDGDDEPDGFGGDDRDDDDDDDDDDQGDDGPDVAELQAQIARLQNSVRRNNSELAKRRLVEQWMQKHEITDLDAWLKGLGIDKKTGQLTTQAVPPAADPPAAQEPASTAATFDEAEVERRVQLRFEQGEARAREENDTLRGALAQAALEAQLLKRGFRSKLDLALRVADLGSIQIDAAGNVAGADEAAESLRAEIPEWFRAVRNGSTPPALTGGEDVDGSNKRRVPAPARSWEEQVVAQLRNR